METLSQARSHLLRGSYLSLPINYSRPVVSKATLWPTQLGVGQLGSGPKTLWPPDWKL